MPQQPQKSRVVAFLDHIELFFRVRNATLFYGGLVTATAIYWMVVVRVGDVHDRNSTRIPADESFEGILLRAADRD